MTIHYRYWGKARPATGGPDWHPLVYHSLDVAAVGQVLLTRDARLQRQLKELTGVPIDKLRPWLVLLLAMHDLGKFSMAFQQQAPHVLEAMLGRRGKWPSNVRHDRLGAWFFQLRMRALWDEISAGCLVNGRRPRASAFLSLWWMAVTGHHGKPPTNDGSELDLDERFDEQGQQAAIAYVNELRSLIATEPVHFPSPRHIKVSSWLVAGIAVLADWLGSYQPSFPYRGFAPDEEPPLSLAEYWEKEALPRAQQVVDFAGVLSLPLRSTETSFEELFPYIHKPSPLQAVSSSVPLDVGPQLFIIEDATGAGKTEAALVLVHRLMAAGHVDGFYVGMPTMATANGMYPRIEDVVPRMFAQAPTIVLAHSSARLAKQLRERQAFKDVADPSSARERTDGSGAERITASQHATAWLEDGGKKALLAQAGVGTIDQALLAALPARHAALRQLGLHRKVLIVDEVHACDEYMLKVLEHLISFQVELGGSVILLSATLAQSQRQRLVKAFSQTSEDESDSRQRPYPSLLHVGKSIKTEIAVESSVRSVRDTGVTFVDAETLTQSLLDVAAQGGCAAWVKNTVSDAIATYEDLRRRAPEGVTVMLFHARFALGHRLEIENEVLRRFGKASTGAERRGLILVATQVIEQSLDLDFDALGSDLAPVDLLVQRAGRLRRHVRDASSRHISTPGAVDARGRPELWVNAPPWSEEPPASWLRDAGMRGTEAVYSATQELWRTMGVLRERGSIRFPAEAHLLIERVYGEGMPTPAGLIPVEAKSEGQDMANQSQGAFVSLKVNSGYELGGAEGAWKEDTVVRTRIGDESCKVRLAVLDGEELRPLIESKGQPAWVAWSLSELSVRTQYIASEHPDDEEIIEAAKEKMSDAGRFVVLVVLHPAGEQRWEGRAMGQRGNEVTVLYDRLMGLQIVEQKGA